jgi:hypothetical protein
MNEFEYFFLQYLFGESSIFDGEKIFSDFTVNKIFYFTGSVEFAILFELKSRIS